MVRYEVEVESDVDVEPVSYLVEAPTPAAARQQVRERAVVERIRAVRRLQGKLGGSS